MAERRYRRYYIGTGGTLVALFVALQLWGLQIIDLSGDVSCESTCTSYFDVRNPTYRSIYIYNKDEVSLDFSPEIKDYELYVKYYGKWVPMDFTLETRLGNVPKDRIYTFVFPRYSTKHFKLVGHKDSRETIKWGFGFEEEYLDPLWLGFFNVLNGLNESRTYEYETTANITANVSTTTFIDILDNTNRYINQSSPFNYTIDLLRTNEFNDSDTSKTIDSGTDEAVRIDNRTDLLNATFNLTGIIPSNKSQGWGMTNNYSYTLGLGEICSSIDILTTTSDGSEPSNFWLNCDSIIYKLISNFTNISSFDPSPAIAAEITRLMTNATDGAEPTEFWGHNRDDPRMYGFNTTPTKFWNQSMASSLCDGGMATNITNANITEFFCSDLGKKLYRFNSTGNLTDTYGIPSCDGAAGIWTNSSNKRISTWWILCNLAANNVYLNQYDEFVLF
ncbi:hypothetical protein LCGC14_1373570 [marine sediment metagenome]|uniref:Uncharacterized protein n=1 Tax=marine sediment metagenome TaxID=412755 RepID=A0A0F9K4Z9_9ZZZZ